MCGVVSSLGSALGRAHVLVEALCVSARVMAGEDTVARLRSRVA